LILEILACIFFTLCIIGTILSITNEKRQYKLIDNKLKELEDKIKEYESN